MGKEVEMKQKIKAALKSFGKGFLIFLVVMLVFGTAAVIYFARGVQKINVNECVQHHPTRCYVYKDGSKQCLEGPRDEDGYCLK